MTGNKVLIMLIIVIIHYKRDARKPTKTAKIRLTVQYLNHGSGHWCGETHKHKVVVLFFVQLK